MKKRVADILVETLIELGINRNFCVVGGGAMHLNNAFVIHKDIKTVFCHHEQACSFAAEGYAKLTGKIATVSVTSGPGAANAINGVYSAWVDSTPMIVISGHPRYNTTVESCGLNIRCRGVQELDIIPMVKGITKYAVMLKNPYEVKTAVITAYNKAMSGRRGPVWISVPLDVQAALIEEEECIAYEEEPEKDCFDIKDLDSVINLLKEAKRPIILTGSGIKYSGSVNAFYDLTKKIQVPIVGGALLSDTLPENYPLYYGLSGNIGPRTGNYIIQHSDCILVLGNSLATRQTGFNVEGFAPDSKIIMCDACFDEMNKPGLNINIKIHCDLAKFIPALCNRINDTISSNENWVKYCDNIKDFFDGYDDVKYVDEQRVPAKLFWKVFREEIPSNAVIALGNSNCTVGIYQYGLKEKDQKILTNYNAGSMGCDLPEAIGAAMGTDAPIICVTGDGSIMMNLQELQTIRFNKFPVKIVVFSNNGYGAIRQTCKNFFNGTYTGCDEDSGISFPDFEDVAKTFGFSFFRCKCCSELMETIKDFISFDGNAFLVVDQLLDDPVNPKIMSKLKVDGTFETPQFTDLSPYLSEDENNILLDYENNLIK